MAAVFCALVAAHKGQSSLPELLKVLPVKPAIKAMALQSCRLQA